MNKPHTGGDGPAFHQNQRSHRQPQTSLSSKGTTDPNIVVVARMPSFGDNCSPNRSPPSIVKINNGGGLLIHSDPFARIDCSFVLLALEAPQLHQSTSSCSPTLINGSPPKRLRTTLVWEKPSYTRSHKRAKFL